MYDELNKELEKHMGATFGTYQSLNTQNLRCECRPEVSRFNNRKLKNTKYPGVKSLPEASEEDIVANRRLETSADRKLKQMNSKQKQQRKILPKEKV